MAATRRGKAARSGAGRLRSLTFSIISKTGIAFRLDKSRCSMWKIVTVLRG